MTRSFWLSAIGAVTLAFNLSAGCPADAHTASAKPRRLQLDARPPHKFRTTNEQFEDTMPELADIISNQDIARRKWEFQTYSYVPRKDDFGYVRSYEIWLGDTLIYQSKKLDHGYYWPVTAMPYNSAVPFPNQPDRTIAMVIGKQAVSHTVTFTAEDLTGNGSADLLVGGYSGGLHCCYSFTLFTSDIKTRKPEKDDKNRKPIVLEAHDSPFFLKDVTNTGSYQLIGYDSTFDSWNCDYKHSPHPLVVLKIAPGRFLLDTNLQKLPPVTAEYMANLVSDTLQKLSLAQAEHGGGCPAGTFYLDSIIWKNMLDLVYCGNGDAAWQYLNMVWNKDTSGWREEGVDTGIARRVKPQVSRDEFLLAFKQQLAHSPYYTQLKELNHWNK
jgi:hypothetical protein